MKEIKSAERLDKVLANSGFGTRKEVRRFIRSKVVSVNGVIIPDPDSKVNISTDKIAINGEVISVKKNIYLMMNKCAGYVCSTRGGFHPTVYDLLNPEEHTKFLGGELHIVGRLDVDTEGLLIFTTDGSLTHRLTSPKYHVSKTYLVYLKNKVSDEEKSQYIEKLSKGVHIAAESNEPEADCLPSDCVWKNESEYENSPACVAELTLYEGKYHEVKRLFAALGNEVVYLKRLSMNKLVLDKTIESGKYRELSEEEVSLLDVAHAEEDDSESDESVGEE
ncbi:MAG: pseudouridine synthase [Treponema sp.]